MDSLNLLKNCTLCPRKCNVNRLAGERGYCQAGPYVRAAKAMLHMWEEPCISSGNGSGAVFFSYCSLSCAFCQNYDISQEHKGRDISIDALSDIYLRLQEKGAANINLVSASHYIPQVIESINSARGRGLSLPVVYNSNGYENVESLRLLEGIVDIYLPDIKYYSDKYAVKYSKAPHYFAHASSAILEMERQVGPPVFEGASMKRGLVIRHLLLPGLLPESKKILDWIKASLPEHVFVSVMSQYVPMYKASEFPEINRRVSARNYEWLLDYFESIGLKNGFMQDMECADSSYTPAFDLEGI